MFSPMPPNVVASTRLGYPSRKGWQITTTSPCLPKGGPKFAVFPVPCLRPPAGLLVARLLLSGDVEQNPGPGRRWQCALCSQYIETKSQTSIRCNHTRTHWVHITCTNITPIQYTNFWKCALHTTHTAPAQSTHPTNTTNQYHPFPNNYCTHRLHSRHSAKGASYQSTYGKSKSCKSTYINVIHKKLTELTHIMKTNNIDKATVHETKLANHHKTPHNTAHAELTEHTKNEEDS